jgi:hypothetical protein
LRTHHENRLSVCTIASQREFCFALAGLQRFVGASDFRLSLWLAIAVAITLTIWAVLRSFAALDHYTGDTKSFLLALARILIVGTVISAFLDLQPLMIDIFIRHHHTPSTPNGYGWPAIKTVLGVLGAFSGTISLVSSPLSRFLKTTQRSRDWRTSILRGITHFAIFLAAIVLPLCLWVLYLYLSAWDRG